MVAIKHFRHYYNERDNKHVSELLRKHGATGYGVYWYVLERLYFNVNRELLYDDNQVMLMAMDVGISKRKLRKIMKTMLENNLVQYQEISPARGMLTSERVELEANEILEMQRRRRKAASVAGKASAKARRKADGE